MNDGPPTAAVRVTVRDVVRDAVDYGFVYDAGSDGGAGMNRYGEIVLRAMR